MNLLIVAAAVCLLMLASSSATNQRMVCEPIEDVCSADGQIQSTRRLFGPPGKRGPPGAEGPQGKKGDRGSDGIVGAAGPRGRKGDRGSDGNAGTKGSRGQKGDRGSDGIVDYSLVDGKLENKVGIATEELRAKVERLERTINSMTHLHPKLLDCNEEGGVFYGLKCYFAIVQDANSRSHGEQICRENNGELGNIVSLEHETLVTGYMRTKIPDGKSVIYVWAAPKYESSTNTIRLSDGKSVAVSTLRWHPSFPSGSSTGIGLQIYSDASHSDQGIYNYPETHGAQGVLCEK